MGGRTYRCRRSLGLPGDVNCPLTEAHAKLKALKENMIANLVKPQFKVEDIHEWLWSEDVLKILRAAGPYAGQHYGYCQGKVVISCSNSPVRFHLFIPKTMACPRADEGIIPQPRKDTVGIEENLKTGFDISERFMQVKKVVAWLEKNATPGAVRYYWPTALSLVGDNHAIHAATNQRYREPPGVAPMIPLFRETSTLIAQALMLPKLNLPTYRSERFFTVSLPDGDTWNVI